MIFTKEQRKQAYAKLPPEVQSFTSYSETTDMIDSLLIKAGISGEQNDLADSEILYAMYGLQNLDQVIQSIATISGKNIADLQGLKSDLQKNIFDEIEKIKNPKTSVDKVISEIAQKYSLNQEQTEKLAEVFLRVGYDKDEPSIFISEAAAELNISDMLAEQVGQDIDRRVNNKPTKSDLIKTEQPKISPQTKSPIPKMIYPENKTSASVPEIKPNNLPIGANGPLNVGVPRYIPGENKVSQITQPVSQTTTVKTGQETGGSKIIYTKSNSNEVVQKPASVPRFDASKPESTVSTPSTEVNKNIIDEKLNKITTGIIENTQNNIQIQKSYGVDPYREPLE